MKKSDPPSDDDPALFYEAVKFVTPLKKDKTRLSAPKSTPNQYRQRQACVFAAPAFIPDHITPTLGIDDLLQFARKEVEPNYLLKLQRGQIEMETCLLLRGLSLLEAEQALQRCIARCRKEHIRYLKIIQGKGLGSSHKKPVLKNALNQWLPRYEEVLAFCSAPGRDGGTGVTYVLLRRAS